MYDVPEESKFRRMARELGIEDVDLAEMTFADVEIEYIDAGFPEILFD